MLCAENKKQCARAKEIIAENGDGPGGLLRFAHQAFSVWLSAMTHERCSSESLMRRWPIIETRAHRWRDLPPEAIMRKHG